MLLIVRRRRALAPRRCARRRACVVLASPALTQLCVALVRHRLHHTVHPIVLKSHILRRRRQPRAPAHRRGRVRIRSRARGLGLRGRPRARGELPGFLPGVLPASPTLSNGRPPGRTLPRQVDSLRKCAESCLHSLAEVVECAQPVQAAVLDLAQHAAGRAPGASLEHLLALDASFAALGLVITAGAAQSIASLSRLRGSSPPSKSTAPPPPPTTPTSSAVAPRGSWATSYACRSTQLSAPVLAQPSHRLRRRRRCSRRMAARRRTARRAASRCGHGVLADLGATSHLSLPTFHHSCHSRKGMAFSLSCLATPTSASASLLRRHSAKRPEAMTRTLSSNPH